MNYFRLMIGLLLFAPPLSGMAQRHLPSIGKVNIKVDTLNKLVTVRYRLSVKKNVPVKVYFSLWKGHGKTDAIDGNTLSGSIGVVVSGGVKHIYWHYTLLPPAWTKDSVSLVAIASDTVDPGLLVAQVDTNLLRKNLEGLALVRDPNTDEGKRNLARLKGVLKEGLSSWGYEVSSQPFRFGDFKGENIIAKKYGLLHPDSVVVICASYDGMPASPGANNNASGIASILEIARIIHSQSFANTIVILATDYSGEEMIGSNNYVFKGGIRPYEHIVAALDLDRVGSFSRSPHTHAVRQSMTDLFPDNYRSILADSSRADFLRVISNKSSGQLAGAFIRSAALYEPSLKIYNEEYPGYGEFTRGDVSYIQFSDHISFWYRKYQAIWLTDARAGGRRDGTPDDTIDKIDFGFMKQVDRISLATVIDLSGIRNGAIYRGAL